ncbi:MULTISPECIES: phosphoadenosine phosphosulfate reductase [Edwardsiella]|uniref:Co-activator of prophage gene expression IbrA n=2 Tax=Edwardsiella anguillarum TaxID=1821960 RepID=A0A076LKL2_9GAMM|nr:MULTISPECIES: DUF3440 domain-containing protein [Edwardsiella]AKM47128.1 hypothetical protein QY76_07105 [Edwardsiella sp. EA181011]GAJ67425.1 immunoglobulin-binding regulator A [Edwardsiella piscicida]AIJ07253.1 Co-activator of prophage gene expression IbrA [Edwardsiella anguillarum ET080813]AKR78590.1 DUF3440 domain-containing protein [Edwardsiella sp. LADL05-105]KAB0590902.1 DUF3440 domain-containing protein [Edwardsiella anguillarum]
MKKIPLKENVFVAAYARMNWIFDTFPRVCVSFSGGKDSTVLLHIAAEVARRKKRRIFVLFVDWEVQFSHTIQHIERMRQRYQDVIERFFWVALPLTTASGVSQYETEWTCWQPGVTWVRQPPPDAITDPAFFPFHTPGISFEAFVVAFSLWLSGRKSMATLVGIRADESLNRFMAVASHSKLRYDDDKPWTTASQDGFYYTAYPLYDWKASDIWHFNAQQRLPYNPLYDLMYRAGVPLRQMRICEPFGPEQRKGLWLYHVLEPATWGRACSRVAGANGGAIYANQSGAFYALNRQIDKPPQHTWKSYVHYLLASMPQKTAEHYRNKIAIYLRWYLSHGYPQDIPDSQERDLGARDIPSWRRICKTLIKNDFWCRTLSFSPNRPQAYARYVKRIQQKRHQWEII